MAATEINLGRSDFRNAIYLPGAAIAGITSTQANSIAFFGGAIGRPGQASTPNDGVNYLVRAAFGQSVVGDIVRPPDFLLGQLITPRAVSPSFGAVHAISVNPTGKAFVPDGTSSLYASEPGFATVVWANAVGTAVSTNRYLISGEPFSDPMAIYWTDRNGVPTGAPTVDFASGPNVVVHTNSSIPSLSALTMVGTQLRATGYEGIVVIEYRDRGNGAFLNVEIVRVARDQPDWISEAVTAEELSPSLPLSFPANNLARPFVSSGLALVPPSAYQVNQPGAPNDGGIYPVRPTGSSSDLTVFWRRTGQFGLIWPFEMHSYNVDWPGNFDTVSQRIYVTHTAAGTPTGAPEIILPAVNVSLHFNGQIGSGTFGINAAGRLTATNVSGRVLIRYDNAPQTSVFLFQHVDVRSYAPDATTPADIGFKLNPAGSPPDSVSPLVSRGLGDSPPYVYQHSTAGPQFGEVYSVRKTTADDQVEVFWRRKGLLGVVWPYEMHRYIQSWPQADAAYQNYVRGVNGVLGPGVDLPANLNTELMPFQEPFHANLANSRFFTVAPGRSLLKHTPGDAVMFTVVRSVQNDDNTYFDLSLRSQEIGREITDPYHQGQRPGYVHLPGGDRYDWEMYDGGKVGDPPEFQTGQIIPVNTGQMEVWWSNLRFGVQWPSLVRRYLAIWPPNPTVTYIAGGEGTRGYAAPDERDVRIYYQNNPTSIGFNPNDEHAFLAAARVGLGVAAFPLRDDLGSQTTSLPHLLIKYRQPSGLWRYEVFRVIREDATHRFDGLAATAGQVIQPPAPLNLRAEWLTYLAGLVEGFSGPVWVDQQSSHWAKAAGDDGHCTNIVMRYRYRTDDGFYFPSTYFNFFPPGVPHVNTPPPSLFPWLDLAANTPSVPIAVTYEACWPSDAPVLRIGESLVDQKFSLPNVRAADRAEVIYSQTTATGLGPNAWLTDATSARAVPLPLSSPPADLKTIRQSPADTDRYFLADAPLSLRDRIWFDRFARQLVLKGAWTPAAISDQEPAGYLRPNVLSPSESQALLKLSTDGAYREAVRQLGLLDLLPPNADGSKRTVEGTLALTAGRAKAPGYVTLAFNNSPDSPNVSVQVLRVACPVYVGGIAVIQSGDPFDERISVRHTADFGGHPENYWFDWRVAETGAEPPSFLQWGFLDGGEGVNEVTIRGPGKRALVNNTVVCRIWPKSVPNLCGTDENTAAWTTPQLVPGWLSRVQAGINPFQQRYTNYANASVDTRVSMIQQAGPRWNGDVPLTATAATNFGLIEIYETVFNRGCELSIEGTPPEPYQPVSDELLRFASILSDLYMLLGNEAYSDAQDPTVGFASDDPRFGDLAPTSVHAFQGQVASLLEEELALLRGRDDTVTGVRQPPVFNHLFWNFTTGPASGGEVAYALTYDIRDSVANGSITAADAQTQYPQGHGDAWGHYLSALKVYYRLLRNPNFNWIPRAEKVPLGAGVTVNFFDERRFARAAAARAKTGAEVVNLVYRDEYKEDPALQYKGYLDANPDRAWGLSEWASRAGQGAFFDWVVANAVLPTNSSLVGVEKVDRTTVPELDEILAAFQQVQEEQDKADTGLNPVGLVRNAIPFDINPDQVLSPQEKKTHFEQIYDRARTALNNAATVFDRAQGATRALRRQSDTVADFSRSVTERESDFNNRLIETFGTPYREDTANPAWPNGPDLDHFTINDQTPVAGGADGDTITLTVGFQDLMVDPQDGSITRSRRNVRFDVSSVAFEMRKPENWTRRGSPGELQIARSDLILSLTRFEKTLSDYQNLIADIDDRASLLKSQGKSNAEELRILNTLFQQTKSLDSQIVESRGIQLEQATAARIMRDVLQLTETHIGAAVTLATGGAAEQVVGAALLAAFELTAGTYVRYNLQMADFKVDQEAADQLAFQLSKEELQQAHNFQITAVRQEQQIRADIKSIEQLVRQLGPAEYEIYSQREAVEQAAARYRSAVSRGSRLLAERDRFRQQTAAQIQQYRYRDMGFRIVRNDAIQKYRAAFDFAAMYAYLATKTYDFETNLKDYDLYHPDSRFYERIVRERLLGGPGSGTGLVGMMDDLHATFSSLKSQLGFDAPSLPDLEFSLRSQLLRIRPGFSDNVTWQEALTRSRVSDISTLPEVRTLTLYSPTQIREPGLVISFETTVNRDLNYFGWPAGPGDSRFIPDFFSTKIQSVGVTFQNYNAIGSSPGGLLQTPSVYLIPIGLDVLRCPKAFPGDEVGVWREWRVWDQWLPAPVPLSSSTGTNLSWIPIDWVSGNASFGAIRGQPAFYAFHDGLTLDKRDNPQYLATRLIGRSVWNTRWLLIIPASSLLASIPNGSTVDAYEEGLNRFIYGGQDGSGGRDGAGVSDIRLRIKAYSYSGR